MSENFDTAQRGIPEFYAGKTVAVTGATGFLGQCVVEKLLRCCPGVRRVYLFIRARKKLSCAERLDKLTQLPLFDNLRALRPNFASQLSAIQCDIEKDNFDLDAESLEIINSEVNVFIHSAATLRFNEHLRLSYQINVLAVRSLIKLCKNIRNLESVVHISTAYSNCNNTRIKETVYDSGCDLEKLEGLFDILSDEAIQQITPHIVKDRPNTYTLTKAFGEEVLVKEGGGLPLCIVRPSIVGAAMAEPVPGWCSNVHGPTGMLIALGKGLLRIMNACRAKTMDIIPVDLVVNGIISAAWKTALDRMEPKIGAHSQRRETPIYHLVMDYSAPVTMEKWNNSMIQSSLEYPLDNAFRTPFMYVSTNKCIFKATQFVTEYTPAMIFDAGLLMTGRKPKLLKIVQRMVAAQDVLTYFLTNEWVWETNNLKEMQDRMNPSDKMVFNFNPSSINVQDYMDQYFIGVKRYLLKEDVKGYPAARQHLQRLRILGYCCQFLVFMVTWRLFISRTNLATNIWQLFIRILSKIFRVNFLQNKLVKLFKLLTV